MAENGAPLHGFAPYDHTLWLAVRGLRLSRGWSTRSWSSNGGVSSFEAASVPATVTEAISGLAELDDDTITVIGFGGKSTRKLSFALEEFVDDGELTRRWRQALTRALQAGKDGTVDTEQAKYVASLLRAADENFEKRPPTVTLGFIKKDPEIAGAEEQWYLECHAPGPVFRSLANDLHQGRLRGLHLSLRLAPSLTNDPYPDSQLPLTLGILRMGKYGSGTGWGWLESISWKPLQAQPPNPKALRRNSPLVNESFSAGIRYLTNTLQWGLLILIVTLTIIALTR